MTSAEQYCSSCYRLIPLEAMICPVCGVLLAALSAREHEDKLIAALHHPLADVRMRAVIALGMLRSARAALPLRDLAFRHPVDIVEGLAVVESLAQLAPADVRHVLSEIADQHPARAVREAARRNLV